MHVVLDTFEPELQCFDGLRDEILAERSEHPGYPALEFFHRQDLDVVGSGQNIKHRQPLGGKAPKMASPRKRVQPKALIGGSAQKR